MAEEPKRGLRPDTRLAMERDAQVLSEARAILVDRFRTGKYDATAVEVRKAVAELLSRARHPSRSVPMAGGQGGQL